MVQNPGVSKRTKSAFFNQFALKQMAAVLLDNTTSAAMASADVTEHVREAARQVLRTLCMNTQLGVCYKPKDLPFGLEK